MQLVLGNASETLSVPKKKEAKSIFKRAFILKFGRPRTPESTVALGSLAGPYFAFVADSYPASRAGHVELESGVLSECPFCWRDQDSPSHLVRCTRVMALVSADTDVTDYLECLRDPPVSFNTLGSARFVGEAARTLLRIRVEQLKDSNYLVSLPKRRPAIPVVQRRSKAVGIVELGADWSSVDRYLADFGRRSVTATEDWLDSGLTASVAYLAGCGSSPTEHGRLRGSVARWVTNNPSALAGWDLGGRKTNATNAAYHAREMIERGGAGDDSAAECWAMAMACRIEVYDFYPVEKGSAVPVRRILGSLSAPLLGVLVSRKKLGTTYRVWRPVGGPQ